MHQSVLKERFKDFPMVSWAIRASKQREIIEVLIVDFLFNDDRVNGSVNIMM